MPRRLAAIPVPMQWVAAPKAGFCAAAPAFMERVAVQPLLPWEKDLSQAVRARFGCRYRTGRYEVPNRTRIRDVLSRVNPNALYGVLQDWNALMAFDDEGLAIDGKTISGAIDAEGHRPHIFGVVGHQSKVCHTQKRSVRCLSMAAMN